MKTTQERFNEKHIKHDSGCWFWTAAKSDWGYGCFWDGKRLVGAHRWSYEQVHGKLPRCIEARHTCHNRDCVNPAHIKPGTRQDNANDMVEAERQSKGESRPTSRLKEADVLKIRSEIKSGKAVKQIAREYDIAHSAIRKIKTGQAWKHVI